MRSATAATTAPGSNASDMIRSFASVDQRRRRSTVEMISAAMCLTVLSHVLKDSMLHPIRRSPASRLGRSREGTLTFLLMLCASSFLAFPHSTEAAIAFGDMTSGEYDGPERSQTI